ncbi:MAG: aryl-sulfate sulfotransferase [Candidatus Thermoplasmatota archaeon]|nr:aryl-sulfate sulfotransferase [Candidatus Thermoplasmatota archaeon]
MKISRRKIRWPICLCVVLLSLLIIPNYTLNPHGTCSASVSSNLVFSEELINQSFIQSNSDTSSFEGYILFSPMASRFTYLIDSDGKVAHTWRSDNFPGYSVYLRENGNLVHTNYLPPKNTIFIPYSHGGGVEEIAPDGTVIWRYEYRDDYVMAHHDVELLPNGNYLMICQEYIPRSKAINAGRNPSLLLPNRGLLVDYVIEVKPIGSNSGLIVWEWYLWDHLIQEYDPDKNNYGNVSAHPELVDINFIDDIFVSSTWTRSPLMELSHINSVHYNEEFDQIILSAALFNEFWIIDHSTTTRQAAGNSGGRSGKGGDILYRWGNPQTYRAGDASDRVFFDIHDAQWIGQGRPGEGNILVFNNGFNRPDGSYSSIHEIVPAVDFTGKYHVNEEGWFGPIDSLWVYTAENPTDFYGTHLSGCQRLPSGNTLICSGPPGIFYEVTPEMEVIWSYTNRLSLPNQVFKIRHYPADYPGIINLLTPDPPRRPNGKIFVRSDSVAFYSTTISFSENLSIVFDWGDGTDSGWVQLDDDQTDITLEHSWNNSGLFFIRAKSKNEYDIESPWSRISPVIVFDLPFFLR